MPNENAPLFLNDEDQWLEQFKGINTTQTEIDNFDLTNQSELHYLDDLRCKWRYKNETEEYEKLWNFLCPADSDTVLCWPPTPTNTTSTQKCFSILNGIRYNDTQNATRDCLFNGTWSKTNYESCEEILSEIQHLSVITTTIYYVGYSLSIIVLLMAVAIFFNFKELRCLRNTIHTNLMIAHMSMCIIWILTTTYELHFYSFKENTVSCIILVMLLYYFNSTIFFWMFVEGLYLYILVVKTLTRENFKLRTYIFIGWGVPLIFAIIWAIAKIFVPINIKSDQSTLEWHRCPWLKTHEIDWIYQTPIVIVLFSNLLFLIAIMWVLITKLRSANTIETQQYRKAAKALLVLKPLLGISYILTVIGPWEDYSYGKIYAIGRAVFLSIQGLTVALLYCFLNADVQNTIRHRINNWKDSRTIGGKNRRRSESRNKDWSPRSRTESIRFTEWTIVTNEENNGNLSSPSDELINDKL